MHNKYIIFFCLINTVFAQVSLSDINRMSNEKLDEIRAEIESSNVNSQESTISSSSIEEVNISPPVSNRKSDSTLFGYSYFDKTINFFDNTPTPENFKLGPGDEIIVSLWGETNFQRNFIINKEGMIYYADIGFISLSNKTLKEAESILEDKLSSIYATLKDKQNSTRLMIELERLKSINNAIKSNKDLAFSYYKVKQKKWMKRKIKPSELTKEIWIDGKTKFVLDNLYLVGHCYLRDEKRTFRVDRIKGLKISK